MDHKNLFESVIGPATQNVGLYGVSREARFEGRDCIVTHKVSKTVYTDFDGKLSRYLAATKGRGLPGASVETRICDVETSRTWTPSSETHVASVPEALAIAARRAVGDGTSARVRIGAWVEGTAPTGTERVITDDVADVLERAFGVCRQIGTTEFLELSGNFDRVMVRPRDGGLDVVKIDLHQGTLTVPGPGGDAQGWTGPVFGFEKAAVDNPAVAGYLGRAHHSIALAKEEAILAFRDAAEARILSFDTALAHRPLTGHRLDAALSLVGRLKAGLGSSLLGLSETAQMTALDWADQLQTGLQEGLPQAAAHAH
jgi:hypothetical protein